MGAKKVTDAMHLERVALVVIRTDVLERLEPISKLGRTESLTSPHCGFLQWSSRRCDWGGVDVTGRIVMQV